MNHDFFYNGKNISISLLWTDEILTLRLFRINPEQHNGDIFFSNHLFIDHGEICFGHLELPFSSINASPRKPYVCQLPNITKPVFDMFCEAIKYFDIHTQNQMEGSS